MNFLIALIKKFGLDFAIKKYGKQFIINILKSEFNTLIKSLMSSVDKIAVNKILSDYKAIINTAEKNLKFAGNPLAVVKKNIHQLLLDDPVLGEKLAKEKLLEGGGYYAKLSSSWVQSAVYYKEEQVLELKIKKNSTWYTYKNVPNFIWEAMRAARGKNGTGAGSVLWRGNILASKRTSIYTNSKKYVKSYIL